jgi:hypothetical protein
MKVKKLFEEIIEKFIIDNNEKILLKGVNGTKDMKLHRYACWGGESGRAYVKETSDDLQYLMKKYDIPSNHVFKQKPR